MKPKNPKFKPKTIQGAVDYLLDDDGLKYWLAMDEDRAMGRAHMGMGMWIRNNWIYPDYSADAKDGTLVKAFFDLGIRHHDDMSGIILTCAHREGNGKALGIERQIKSYRKYWGKDADSICTE